MVTRRYPSGAGVQSDGDATPPAPQPEPEPFDQFQSDVLIQVIVELRKEWREERDEAIAPLKGKIA